MQQSKAGEGKLVKSWQRSAKWLAMGVALAALTVGPVAAPAALASGGADSGGSGGGGSINGGGSGGGSGGGGGSTTTTTCVSISSLSNAVGYYSAYAAVWTSFSIASSSCSGGSSGTWQLTFHNDDTGAIDYTAGGSYRSGASYNTMIDDDFAPFSTNYTVTLSVTDPRGTQTSRSALAVTPAPKVGP